MTKSEIGWFGAGVVVLAAFFFALSGQNTPSAMNLDFSKLAKVKSVSESQGKAVLRDRAVSPSDVSHAELLYGNVKAKVDETITSLHFGIDNGFSDDVVSSLQNRIHEVDADCKKFTDFSASRPGSGAGRTEQSQTAVQAAIELGKHIDSTNAERRERNRQLAESLRLAPWDSLRP